MMNYVVNSLKRFHHFQPHRPQDQPYPHIKPTYRANKQYAADLDTYPLLIKEEIVLYRK